MTAVTILCPNNRRVVVKLETGTTLFQILDEACKKQGFVSDNYALKHHNKFVDLSLTFRMTGLPQNCTLEMIENGNNTDSKEDVEVALQMPEGNRLTKHIPSDATLLDMLLCFEAENGLKLLEPEGEDMHPVCRYLNTDYVGTLSLAATTLKSMGIRGRALFRYVLRKVNEEEMSQINEEIERQHLKLRKLEAAFSKKVQENMEHEQSKAQEASLINQLAAAITPTEPLSVVSVTDNGSLSVPMEVASVSSAISPLSNVSATTAQSQSNYAERQAKLDALQQMLSQVDHSIAQNTDLPWDFDNMFHVPNPQSQVDFSNFKFPEATKGMDLTSLSTTTSAIGASFVEPCDRRTTVYRKDDKLDIGTIEPPPEFFDINTNDVRLQQQRLHEQILFGSQRAMLPKSVVKEKEMQCKIKAWKFSVVRIHFPDGNVLQGTFRSLETVASLYSFVKESLANDKIMFKLTMPPNIALDKMEQNLIELGLAPRSTLIFRLRLRDAPFFDGQFLKAELVESLKSQAEAELTAHECLLQNETYVPYRPPLVQSNDQSPSNASLYEDQPRASSSSSSTRPKDPVNKPKWLQGSK